MVGQKYNRLSPFFNVHGISYSRICGFERARIFSRTTSSCIVSGVAVYGDYRHTVFAVMTMRLFLVWLSHTCICVGMPLAMPAITLVNQTVFFRIEHAREKTEGKNGLGTHAPISLTNVISHQDLGVTNQIAEWLRKDVAL